MGNTGGTGATGTGGSGGKGGNGGNGGTTGGAGGNPYPAPTATPADEDGSQLWLRYPKVNLPARLAEYQAGLTQIVTAGSSASLQAAQAELVKGLSGLLGTTIPVVSAPTAAGAVVLGTPTSSTIVSGLALGSSLTAVGNEGYLVQATTVGGKAAVLGDEIQRWLASLFHGPNLGLTICALSLVVAGAFLFFTRTRK